MKRKKTEIGNVKVTEKKRQSEKPENKETKRSFFFFKKRGHQKIVQAEINFSITNSKIRNCISAN